jgi:uncharacterized protein YfkK (UPF0435 family)
MTYNINFSQKPTYFHVIVTGENNKENVARYMEDIQQKCEEVNCLSVLIEERLEGPRLNTLDIFQLVTEGSSHAIGKFQAIAYVDINAVNASMQFAETVAVNRAIPVRVFDTVDEAENWLLALDQSST